LAQRRFLAAFDLHGDQAHNGTVNAFLRFAEDWKPHDRIMGGDVWDFRPLRGKASAEEKRESLLADFGAGFSFLEQFRPTTLLLGNHDKRLWDQAARLDGPASDLAVELVGRVGNLASRLRFPVLPYHKRDGVARLGRMNFLHGFSAGKSAVKEHADVYGPCVFGHIHAADHYVHPGYGDSRREAWSAPCMCKVDMEYNAATPGTLRYDNGWVYGVWDEKSYTVFVAKVREGKVTVASGTKEIAA
jgi:hypothetical protein